MRMDKSLISGSTSMLVLRLLEEGDLYGYQMIERLRERSNYVFELKAGTLYPLLHGMEEKGFLTSYEQEEGGKQHVLPESDGENAVVRKQPPESQPPGQKEPGGAQTGQDG